MSCERLFVFTEGGLSVINHAPTADALVFRAGRNVMNHAPTLSYPELSYFVILRHETCMFGLKVDV